MSIDRSTIWPYENGEPGTYYYSRYANPTVDEAERALGALDGGHALLFPSGTGAATALALGLLRPGDTIALAEGCYFGTGVNFKTLERWGLRTVEFDQTTAPPKDVQLVWLEAPSNPFLTMPDLEAAAAHPARGRGRRHRRDARPPAPARARRRLRAAQRDEVPRGPPRRPARRRRVQGRGDGERACASFRTVTGIVAAPDPAFLLLRGLKTLEVRVLRQTASAGLIAERLREPSPGRDGPVSRLRRPHLLRRRRRRRGPARRDGDAA